MPTEQEPDDDPIARLMEWQDHRYDPGYFVGARIHPVLSGRRRNRFGYLLIISGSVCLLITLPAIEVVFSTLGGMLVFLVLFGLSVLQLVAGIKLLRRPAGPSFDAEEEDEGDDGEQAFWRDPAQAPGQEGPPTPRPKSRRPYTR